MRRRMIKRVTVMILLGSFLVSIDELGNAAEIASNIDPVTTCSR